MEEYSWDPRSVTFWFKGLKSWDQLEVPKGSNLYYPLARDLVKCAALVVCIVATMRFLLTKFIYRPLAISLKLSGQKTQSPYTNVVLEKEFQKCCKGRSKKYMKELQSDKKDKLESLAASSGLSQRQVSQWLRQRCNSERFPKAQKFMDSAWKLTYYTGTTFSSLYLSLTVHYDCLVTPKACFEGLPLRSVESPTFWLHLTVIGFYTYSFMTVFIDPARKDFWMMFTHHIISVFTYGITFISNNIPMAIVLLFWFDVSDIFLESGKICNYLGKKSISQHIFTIFAVAWTVPRNIIYPLWYVTAVWKHGPDHIGTPMFRMVFTTVLLLLLLNLLWTVALFKAIARVLKDPTDVADTRSESELSDSDEPVEENGVNGHIDHNMNVDDRKNI